MRTLWNTLCLAAQSFGSGEILGAPEFEVSGRHFVSGACEDIHG